MVDSSVVKKIATSIAIKDGRCPNGHSLMSKEKRFDGQDAVAAKVRLKGREGMIYLNPFYGRFEYKCDLELRTGDVVDLYCPTCDTSLKVDTTCRLCNIPMFAVQMANGGQVEACPKVGCHNHSLKIVNLDEQLERMYVGETKFQM